METVPGSSDGISSQNESMEVAFSGHKVAANDSAVVRQYSLLYDSAMKHFTGTKEVNRFSRHEWRSFFSRTFEAFAELWQFLSKNVSELNHKGVLPLHTVAEVASKIGQLFYHTYVQCSDVDCLHQAYWFYSTVQEQGFCDETTQQQSPASLHLRMRYLARFISVSLLLGRSTKLKELVEKLEDVVSTYRLIYPSSSDCADWLTTTTEARSLMEALGLVQVSSREIILEHRATLSPAYIRSRRSLRLDEVILASYTHKQVRFSQLSLDMIRMVYALEVGTPDRHAEQDAEALPSLPRRRQNGDFNPRKCLLHRPSVPELLAELSAIMKDVSSNSITLVYLSCDGTSRNVSESFLEGQSSQDSHTSSSPYSSEGLMLRPPVGSLTPGCQDNLYPSDLTPFTRRPMFLIVDSNDASAFKAMGCPFHQPFVSLLAAQRIPDDFADHKLNGRLMTLFLSCPLTALCYVCNLVEVTESLWTAASNEMTGMLSSVLDCLRSSSQLDPDICLFLDDFFTSTLLSRFVFSLLVFRHHYAFPNSTFWPSIHPSLPDDLVQSPALSTALLSVANSLDVRQLFD